MKVDFVRSFYKFNKLQNSPHYQGCRILGNDLAIVFSTQKKAYHKKPVFVGATILEHAKFAMIDKLYNMLAPNFPQFDLVLTGMKILAL